MAFDPDEYLAAKTGGDFDPDAYLAAKEAPPTVDVKAMARARELRPPGPRELTAEEAGTMAGPIKRQATRILPLTTQAQAPADLPPGDEVRIAARHAGKGQGVLGQFGQPKTLTVGAPQGEMSDPLMQMGTATALGMAAGAPFAAIPRVGATLAPSVEGATGSLAAGASAKEAAAFGLLPFVPPALRAAKAGVAKLAPSGEKALKNARGWVAKDIAGDVKGASTPTARKQLADDAENAATLVLKDRKLDKAIDRAASGNVDDLNAVQEMVQERLATVEAERLAPHWDRATQALPSGGVRSGDYRDFLKRRSEDLRATGNPSEVSEAAALDNIVATLEDAGKWGGRAAKFDPAAKVQGGSLDGMTTGDAIALLEKSKTSATAAAIDEQIAAMRKAATTTGFNPDTIVPARQVQKHWSDVSKLAYKSAGGINGTAAFEGKLDVASHLREFRDDMIGAIAKVDPVAAAQLRAGNRDYSALKRIENVIDQRINYAKGNAQGASFPAGAKRVVQQIKHSPLGFAIGLVPDALFAGKRRFDKWIARRAIDREQVSAVRNIFEAPSDSKRGPLVRAAVAAGVPAAIARWSAEAADGGAKIAEGTATSPETLAEANP